MEASWAILSPLANVCVVIVVVVTAALLLRHLNLRAKTAFSNGVLERRAPHMNLRPMSPDSCCSEDAAAVSIDESPPAAAQRVKQFSWRHMKKKYSYKVTPYIRAYRQCCASEPLRAEAVRLQSAFTRETDLAVPFVWGLLAAAQELMSPPWLASSSSSRDAASCAAIGQQAKESRLCAYYNCGAREFSCNKADDERHPHTECHRCVMCGGPHPLGGWTLEGKPPQQQQEESKCPAWIALSDELRELAKTVGVGVDDLQCAFFAEDGAKPAVGTLSITAEPALDTAVAERSAPSPMSLSPTALATSVEMRSAKVDLAQSRGEKFLMDRNRVLRERYRVEIAQGRRSANPMHSLCTTSKDGALPYTLYCGHHCCCVSRGTELSHHVYFGRRFVSDDATEAGTAVVVKMYESFEVFDEELFEKETQVAKRHNALLEAHAVALCAVTNHPQTLLVMPQYHSSLNALLTERAVINNVERLQLVQSLVDTMWKLHAEKEIAHGDFKPSNILVYREGDTFKTQLCDFELTSLHATGPPVSRCFITAACFTHPMEVLWKRPHVTHDLWALALVLYEVFHFRKYTEDDFQLFSLFFNDTFAGTMQEKFRRVDEVKRGVRRVYPHVPPECIPFPAKTNVLLRDLMLRLMTGTNPTLDDVRDHHLLLIPPKALRDGLIAIHADDSIFERLCAESPQASYFTRLSTAVFDGSDKHAKQHNVSVQGLKTQKRPKLFSKANTEVINLGDGVRVLRNLLADPAFDVSSLYFDVPEFLLALGAKLAEWNVRIDKAEGRLERY